MGMYGVGLFITGPLGDRFKPRIVIFIGTIITALTFSLFGLAKTMNIHSPAYFVVVWSISALSQSTGWPNCIAIMGNWFSHTTRGTVYGFWSANISFGNIMGSLIAGLVLAYADWPYVFFAGASLSMSGGIWLMATLPDSPEDIGEKSHYDEISAGIQVSDDAITPIQEQKPITIWQALRVPGVLIYSTCYAFTKLVNYALFYWLPYYLQAELHFSSNVSALLSAWYDFGGIIGGALGGIISDIIIIKANLDRSIVLVVMLFLATGQLFIYYQYAGVSLYMNVFLMILTGVLIGGPSNIVSSAVSADLGTHPDIKGNKKALATVSGVVDGIACAGSAFGQLAVAALSNAYGWERVFYFFMVMTACGGLVLLPVTYSSFKKRSDVPINYNNSLPTVAK